MDIKKYIRFDTDYVIKSGSWLMLSYVFTILSVLATTYVFANYVSPTVYGEYKYLLTIGVLLSSFTLTGLATAITQGTAKKIPVFFKYATKIGLRYELNISLLAIVGSTYYYFNNDTGLALSLLAIAIFQPLFNNSNLVFSYLQGKEAFRTSTFAHISKITITGITTVISAIYFEDPLILLLTYLITNIVINYMVQIFTESPGPHNSSADSDEVKRLIRYAKHTSVRNIFTGIAGQIDKILIFQNLNAADLAVYTFATALPEQFKSITKSINTMLIPRFSRHEEIDIKKNMVSKTVIYFFILVIMVMSYILIAPYIFKIFFPAYQESIFLSQVFSLATLFSIGGLPYSALQAKVKNKKLYNVEVGGALVQTVSMILLFIPYGLLGVVIGRLIGRAYTMLISYYLFFKT